DPTDPSVVGQPYVITVQVTRAANLGAIAGNVDVSDGIDSCTDTTPSGGNVTTVTYSCTLTSTTSGAKTLTATYQGSTTYESSSDTEAHLVNRADTSTGLTSSVNPSVFGQSVT